VDNGATWKPVVNLSEKNPGEAFRPVIKASGTNVVVAWQDNSLGLSEIFVKVSKDSGQTWSSIINASSDKYSSVDPQMSLSGSSIYLVWNGRIPGHEILFRKSADLGQTWQATFNISKGENASQEPLIDVSGNNVYVIWREYTGTILRGDTFLRRSTDGGATWKTSQNISNDEGYSVYHMMKASGNNVYIAWMLNGGTNDVFLRRSADNGATWKSTVNISNTPGDSYPASIAAVGSNVYIFWTEETGDLFVRRSLDSGATWKSRTDVAGDVAYGVFRADIFVSGANVFAVWTQLDEKADGETYFSRSSDNGASWQPKKNLSNTDATSHDPQVAG
jgi:hypothetical protein